MFQSWWKTTLLLTAVLLAARASAQPEEPSGEFEAEVHLTNGSVIVGTVVEQDTESVRVRLRGSASEPLILPVALIASVIHLQEAPAASPVLTEPDAPSVVTKRDAELPIEEVPRTPAEAGRAMGFGFNAGVGLGYDSTVHGALLGEQHDGLHMDLELPGFEMRLFPVDDFSIDLLFKVGSLAMRHLQEIPGEWYMAEGPFAVMSVYWHFWGRDHWTGAAWITPSLAPGITVGANGTIGPLPVGMHLGFSMRMGVEVSREDRVFGWGVHLRPGLGTGVIPWGIIPDELYQPGAELMVEFTWCWYLPRS